MSKSEISSGALEGVREIIVEGPGLPTLGMQYYTYRQVYYLLLNTFAPLQHANTSEDLKLDNTLVGFEQESVVEDFANAQSSNPMPLKENNGRTVYLSHNDFGPLRSYYILPKITDFGLAHHQKDLPVLNRHPIQPDCYRAPEVILGAGWMYSVDIWNIGLLVRVFFYFILFYFFRLHVPYINPVIAAC